MDDAWRFECSRHKIVIRWKLKGNEYPTEDDEKKMNELASKIDTILTVSRVADVNGFDCGPGSIDMSIYGKETDNDVDDIYYRIRDAFISHRCPPGSCIIRYYQDSGREIVSDTIA